MLNNQFLLKRFYSLKRQRYLWPRLYLQLCYCSSLLLLFHLLLSTGLFLVQRTFLHSCTLWCGFSLSPGKKDLWVHMTVSPMTELSVSFLILDSISNKIFKILINWLKILLLYFSLKNTLSTVLLILTSLNVHMQKIWELLSHIRSKLPKISPVGAGSDYDMHVFELLKYHFCCRLWSYKTIKTSSINNKHNSDSFS